MFAVSSPSAYCKWATFGPHFVAGFYRSLAPLHRWRNPKHLKRCLQQSGGLRVIHSIGHPLWSETSCLTWRLVQLMTELCRRMMLGTVPLGNSRRRILVVSVRWSAGHLNAGPLSCAELAASSSSPPFLVLRAQTRGPIPPNPHFPRRVLCEAGFPKGYVSRLPSSE